jgi:hypothetical protein
MITQQQAAMELAAHISAVERNWAFARAWLFREIQKNRNPRLNLPRIDEGNRRELAQDRVWDS